MNGPLDEEKLRIVIGRFSKDSFSESSEAVTSGPRRLNFATPRV